jgi:hypothetical protein
MSQIFPCRLGQNKENQAKSGKTLARARLMDVLLQNCSTAQYLTRDLAWTNQREEAFVFLSSGEAIDFAYANHLADVHLVLYFKDLSHSLTVPFQTEAPPDLPATKAKPDRPQLL